MAGLESSAITSDSSCVFQGLIPGSPVTVASAFYLLSHPHPEPLSYVLNISSLFLSILLVSDSSPWVFYITSCSCFMYRLLCLISEDCCFNICLLYEMFA